MIRTLCVVAAIALGATVVLAQTDVSQARKEFMKTFSKYGDSILTRMGRDRMPYDQKLVDEALGHFPETASKIPSLFPAGGFQGPVPDSRYYAASKAFESQAQSDIKARTEKLTKALEEAKGKIKDLGSLKAIWLPIDKDHCDSCHEAYRLRRPAS